MFCFGNRISKNEYDIKGIKTVKMYDIKGKGC